MRARRLEGPRPSEELSALIARSRRRVWTLAARQLEQMGESIHTWQLLYHLRRLGPVAQCDLAMVCGQHPAGVSRMLDAMERDLLVRRSRDPDDRRRVRVEATARGLARLKAMQPEVGMAADRALDRLSPEDRRQLRALLEKLLADEERDRL